MLSFWQTDCSAETSLQERERRKSRFFVRLPPRSAIASTTADVCWHVSPYPGQRLGRGKYLHDDDAVCSSPTPPPRGDVHDVAPVKRELPAEQLGEERFCANAHRDDQADDWGCPHPAYLHCWSGIFILLLVGDIHPAVGRGYSSPTIVSAEMSPPSTASGDGERSRYTSGRNLPQGKISASNILSVGDEVSDVERYHLTVSSHTSFRDGSRGQRRLHQANISE